MTILPALWSYVGVVEVKVERVIFGVDFQVRRGVATRAYNLLELQGYKVTAEVSWGSIWW